MSIYLITGGACPVKCADPMKYKSFQLLSIRSTFHRAGANESPAFVFHRTAPATSVTGNSYRL